VVWFLAFWLIRHVFYAETQGNVVETNRKEDCGHARVSGGRNLIANGGG
jgi:hypothetical protein